MPTGMAQADTSSQRRECLHATQMSPGLNLLDNFLSGCPWLLLFSDMNSHL